MTRGSFSRFKMCAFESWNGIKFIVTATKDNKCGNVTRWPCGCGSSSSSDGGKSSVTSFIVASNLAANKVERGRLARWFLVSRLAARNKQTGNELNKYIQIIYNLKQKKKTKTFSPLRFFYFLIMEKNWVRTTKEATSNSTKCSWDMLDWFLTPPVWKWTQLHTQTE